MKGDQRTLRPDSRGLVTLTPAFCLRPRHSLQPAAQRSVSQRPALGAHGRPFEALGSAPAPWARAAGRRGVCKTRPCSRAATEAPGDEVPAQGGPQGPVLDPTGLAKALSAFWTGDCSAVAAGEANRFEFHVLGRGRHTASRALLPALWGGGGGATLIVRTGPERAGGEPVVPEQVSHIRGGIGPPWGVRGRRVPQMSAERAGPQAAASSASGLFSKGHSNC